MPMPNPTTDAAGGAMHPQTMMMGHGYRPEWSEGSLKPPIFQSSTFVFNSAAEGKAFFEVAYGHRGRAPGEAVGLIYSRLNNPNVEILEERIRVWDRAERAAAFESGMAAISTTLMTLLRPGDVVLHSQPLYGGTDHLIRKVLPGFGIEGVGFDVEATADEIEAIADRVGRDRVAMIYVETPANPTNALCDIAACASVAASLSERRRVPVVVDNTYLGPLWQRPLEHGADIVLYSATKYIGGHSDVIAGIALGDAELLDPIRAMRTFYGSVAGPFTAWLLLRSLETMKVRMDAQALGARQVADFLRDHPRVARISYLGHLQPGDQGFDTYQRQCLGAGAMLSVWLDTDEAGAFRFLDALQTIHLAVSLGSTESLAQHPATMTHCDVPLDERDHMGVTEGLVRLSIGIEHPDDLIIDLGRALDAI
ncbi:MAG: cystathionine gamma-synthase family protein [Ilumatobacteraceae bacterium]